MLNNFFECYAKNFYQNTDEGTHRTNQGQAMTPKTIEEKERQTRRSGCTSPNFHGTQLKLKRRGGKSMRTAKRQEKLSESSKQILALQNEKFDDQCQPHKDSLSPNGGTSSREKLSTSMSSSAISTTLPLLKRMWAASEEQKSLLERQIQLERSKRVATGLPHGTRPPKRRCLPSLTEVRSVRKWYKERYKFFILFSFYF
jgi:hypothetical protein